MRKQQTETKIIDIETIEPQEPTMRDIPTIGTGQGMVAVSSRISSEWRPTVARHSESDVTDRRLVTLIGTSVLLVWFLVAALSIG